MAGSSYFKDQLVSADSFNYLRSMILMIYDIGFGDRGYGQNDNATSPTTSNANLAEAHPSPNWPHFTGAEYPQTLITWFPWAQIRDAMNVCMNHQVSDITQIPPESAFATGQLIKAYTAGTGSDFPGSAAISDYNRLTYRPESVSLFGPAAYSSRNTTWTTQIKHCIQVTFASGDEARYFFNSGGQFRFTASRTGDTTQPQDAFWTAFLDKIGMVAMDYGHTFPTSTNPRTGSYADIGYYNLSTFLQRIYWADGSDIDVGQRTEMIFTEGNRVTITNADSQSRADGTVSLNTQVMMQVGSTNTEMKLTLCQSPSIKESCARAVEKISTPTATGSDSADTISHFDSHLYSWTNVYMYETGDDSQMKIIKNAYGMNTFEIWASTNSTGPGANGDRGNILTFEIVFNDIHSNGVGGYDFCTGLFESTMYYQKATRYLGVQDPSCVSTCLLTDAEGTRELANITFTVNDAATASGEWSDTYTYKWSVTNANVFNTFMMAISGVCINGLPGGPEYQVDVLPWFRITTPTGTITSTGQRDQAGCTYRITLEAINSNTGLFNTASVTVTYETCVCPLGFLAYSSTQCQQIYTGLRGPSLTCSLMSVNSIIVSPSNPSTDFSAISTNAVWITQTTSVPLVYEALWTKITFSIQIPTSANYTLQFAINKIGVLFVDSVNTIISVNPAQMKWISEIVALQIGDHEITVRAYNQPLAYPSMTWDQNPIYFAAILTDASGKTIFNAKNNGTYNIIRFACPDDSIPINVIDPLLPLVTNYLVPVSYTGWCSGLNSTALWISNDGITPKEMVKSIEAPKEITVEKNTTIKKQSLVRSLNVQKDNWTVADHWIIVSAKNIDYEAFEKSLIKQGIKILKDYTELDHYLIEATSDQITTLHNDDRVLIITHNHRVSIHSCNGMVLDASTNNWGLYAIAQLDLTDYPNVPTDQVYTWSKGGLNVDIVSLDTGVNLNHEEFTNRTTSVIYDVQADNTIQNPPSFYTSITPSDSSYGSDCCGHGTHVAGIAMGNLYGVAKTANLRVAKVFIFESSVLMDLYIPASQTTWNTFMNYNAIWASSDGTNPWTGSYPSCVIINTTLNIPTDTTYEFRIAVDDTCNFYIDNELQWTTVNNENGAADIHDLVLTNGKHNLQISFYSSSGWSSSNPAGLSFELYQPGNQTISPLQIYTPSSQSNWNAFMNSNAIWASTDGTNPWTAYNPDAVVIITTMNIQYTYSHQFIVEVDDNANFYIDGALKFTVTNNSNGTPVTQNIPLTSGSHTLQIEFYNSSPGWSSSNPAGLALEIYAPNGTYVELQLWTPAKMSQWSDFMNANAIWASSDGTNPWPNGDPDCVIFQATMNVGTAGSYQFVLEVDDGASVYIDGTLQFSYNSTSRATTQNITLTAGTHLLEIPVYNNHQYGPYSKSNPAGVAFQIFDPTGVLIFESRNYKGSLTQPTIITAIQPYQGSLSPAPFTYTQQMVLAFTTRNFAGSNSQPTIITSLPMFASWSKVFSTGDFKNGLDTNNSYISSLPIWQGTWPLTYAPGQSYSELSWVLNGLDAISKWHQKKYSSGIDHPTIINASIGSDSESLIQAFNNVIDVGIVVAAAAGNSGIDLSTDPTYAPANASYAITVGALGLDETDPNYMSFDIADYSNYGAVVDVFAPGSQIRSADYSKTTGSVIMSGTSMATPFVTGVLAQWMEGRHIAYSGLEAKTATNLLISSCTSKTKFYLPSTIAQDTINRFLITPYVCEELDAGTTSDDIKTIGLLSIPSAGTYQLQASAQGIALFFIDGKLILQATQSSHMISQNIILTAGPHTIEIIARNSDNGTTQAWVDNPAGFGFALYDSSSQLVYTSQTANLMKVHFDCADGYVPNYSAGKCVQYNTYAYTSFLPNVMIPVRHDLWSDNINAVAVWASVDGINPMFTDSRWVSFNVYFSITGTGTSAINYTLESGADDRYKVWIDGSLILQHDTTGWYYTRISLAPGPHVMNVQVKNTPNGYEGWENNPVGFGFNIRTIDTSVIILNSRNFNFLSYDFIPGNLEYVGSSGSCVRTLYTPCVPNSIPCFHYVDGAQNQGFGWTLVASPLSRVTVTVQDADSYTIWVQQNKTYNAGPLAQWITFYYIPNFPVDDIYHIGIQCMDEAQIWIDNNEILSVGADDGYQEVILGYKAGQHLILVKVMNLGNDTNWTTNPGWVTANIRRQNGILVWNTTDSSYKQPKQLYFDGQLAQPDWVVGNYFYTDQGWIAFDQEQYMNLNFDVWYAVNRGTYLDGTPCPGLLPAQHFINIGAWESTIISSRCIDNDTALLPPNCAKYIDGNNNESYGFTLVQSSVLRTDRLIGNKIVPLDITTHYYYTLYRGNLPALASDIENQLIFTTLGWFTWTSAGYLLANPDVEEALASGLYADGSPVPPGMTAAEHYMTRGLDPDVAWTRCVAKAAVTPIHTLPPNPVIVTHTCYHYVDSSTNQLNGWTLAGPYKTTLYYKGAKATISQVDGALFWTNAGSVQFDPVKYIASNTDLQGLTNDQATEEFITQGAYQGTLTPPRCMWLEATKQTTVCYSYSDVQYNWSNGWTLSGTGNKILYYQNSQATNAEVVGATFMTPEGTTIFDPVTYKQANPSLQSLSNAAATQQFILEGAWGGTQTPPTCINSGAPPPTPTPKPVIVEQYCYAYVDGVVNQDNGWTLSGSNGQTLYYKGVQATINQVNGSVFMTTSGLKYFDPEDYRAANQDLAAYTDDQATEQFITAGAWEGTQTPPRCMTNKTTYQETICYAYVDGPENQNNGWTLSGLNNQVLYYNNNQATISQVNGSSFYTNHGWMEFNPQIYKAANSDLSSLTDDQATTQFINQGAWQSMIANLLINPGFEDATGWTNLSRGTTPVHSGTYAAYLDNTTLSQTVNTVLNNIYSFSFWGWASNSSGNTSISVKWNNTTLVTGFPLGVWTQFTFQVKGTGSDIISFVDAGGSGSRAVDDTSLILQNATRCMQQKTQEVQTICYNYVDDVDNRNNGWTLAGVQNQHLFYNGTLATIAEVSGATLMTSQGPVVFTAAGYKAANPLLQSLSDNDAITQFINQGAWQGTQDPPTCIKTENVDPNSIPEEYQTKNCTFINDTYNQNNGWTMVGGILYYNGSPATPAELNGASFDTTCGVQKYDPETYRNSLSNDDLSNNFIDEGAADGNPLETNCSYLDDTYNQNNGWTIVNGILYYKGSPATIQQVNGTQFDTTCGLLAFDPEVYRNSLSNDELYDNFINEGAADGNPMETNCTYLDDSINQNNGWTLVYGILHYNGKVATPTDLEGAALDTTCGTLLFEPENYRTSITDDELYYNFITGGAYNGNPLQGTCTFTNDVYNQNNGWTFGGPNGQILYHNGSQATSADLEGATLDTTCGPTVFHIATYRSALSDTELDNDFIQNGAAGKYPLASNCKYLDDAYNRNNGWTIGGTNGKTLLYQGNPATENEVMNATFDTTCGKIQFNPALYRKALTDDELTQDFIDEGASKKFALASNCKYLDDAYNRNNGWTIGGTNGKTLLYHGKPATPAEIDGATLDTTCGKIQFNPSNYRNALTDDELSQDFIDDGAAKGHPLTTQQVVNHVQPGIYENWCFSYLDGTFNQNNGWTLGSPNTKMLYYNGVLATTTQVNGASFDTSCGTITFNVTDYRNALSDDELTQDFIDEGANNSWPMNSNKCTYLDDAYNQAKGFTINGTVLYFNNNPATISQVNGTSFNTTCGVVVFNVTDYRNALTDDELIQDFINEGANNGNPLTITGTPAASCTYLDDTINQTNGWTLNTPSNKVLCYNGIPASVGQVDDTIFMTNAGPLMFNPLDYKRNNLDLQNLTNEQATNQFINIGAWQGTQDPARCIIDKLMFVTTICYAYQDNEQNQNNGWTLQGTNNQQLYYNGTLATITQVNGATFMTNNGWIMFDPTVYRTSNPDLMSLSNDQATQDFINNGAYQGTLANNTRCFAIKTGAVDQLCFSYLDNSYNKDNGWTLEGTNGQQLFYNGKLATTSQVINAWFMTSSGWVQFDPAEYKRSNPKLANDTDADATLDFINEGAYGGTLTPPICISSYPIIFPATNTIKVVCYNYANDVTNEKNGWGLGGTNSNILYYNGQPATPTEVEGATFDTSQGPIVFNADEYNRINSLNMTDDQAANEFINEGAYQGTQTPPRCIDEKEFTVQSVCYNYLDDSFNQNNGWTIVNKTLYLNGSQATINQVNGATFKTGGGIILFDPSTYQKNNSDLQSLTSLDDVTNEFITEGAWQGTQNPPRCIITDIMQTQIPNEFYCYNYIDGPDNRNNGWTLAGSGGEQLYFNGSLATITQVNGAVFMTSNGNMKFNPIIYKKFNSNIQSLTDDQATTDFINRGAYEGTQNPPVCFNGEYYPNTLVCYSYVDGPDNQHNGWTINGGGTNQPGQLYYQGKLATIAEVNFALLMTQAGWLIFDPEVYKQSNSDLSSLTDDQATTDFINQGAWQGTQSPPRCMQAKQNTGPPPVTQPPETVCWNYVDDGINRAAGWNFSGNGRTLYYNGVLATITEVNGASFSTSQGMVTFNPVNYRAANSDLQNLTDDQATTQFINEGAWEGTQNPPRCMQGQNIPSTTLCFNYVDGSVNQNNGWTLFSTTLYYNGAQATIAQVNGAVFMTGQGSINFDPGVYKEVNPDLQNLTDDQATEQFITAGAWEGTQNPPRCIATERVPAPEPTTTPAPLVCFNYVNSTVNQNNGWTLSGSGNQVLYKNGTKATITQVNGATLMTSGGFVIFSATDYKAANPDLQYLSDTDATQQFINIGAWQGTQNPPRCMATQIEQPSGVNPDETACWNYVDWHYNWDNGWTLDGKDQKILYFFGEPAKISEVNGATFMTNAGTLQFDATEYKRVNSNISTLSDADAIQYFINQGAWEGTQIPPGCMSMTTPDICYIYVDGPDNQGNGWTINKSGANLLYNGASPAISDVNGARFYGTAGWFTFDPNAYIAANSSLSALTPDQATLYFIDEGAYDSAISNTCIVDPPLSICYSYIDDSHNRGNGWTFKASVLQFQGANATIAQVNGSQFYTSNGWITFDPAQYIEYNSDLSTLSNDDATTHFINKGAYQSTQIPPRCIINPPVVFQTSPRPFCYAYVDVTNNHRNGWTMGGSGGQELYYNGNPATVEQVNEKLFWTTMGWVKFNPLYYLAANTDLGNITADQATMQFIQQGAYQGTITPRRCIYVYVPGIEGCNRYVDGVENKNQGWSLVDVGMLTPELQLNSLQLQYDDGSGSGPKRATIDQVQNCYFFSSYGWVVFNADRYILDNPDVLVFGGDTTDAINHFIDFGAFESTYTSTEFSRCISNRAEGDVELGSTWSRVYDTGNPGDPATTYSKNPTQGEWTHLPDGSQRVLKTCASYLDCTQNQQDGWYMSSTDLFYCKPPCTLLDAEINGEAIAVAQLNSGAGSLYTRSSSYYTFNESELLQVNPDYNAIVQSQTYFDGHTLADFEQSGTQLFTVTGAWEGTFGRCFGSPGRTVYNLGQYQDNTKNQAKGFTFCPNTDSDYPFTTYGKCLCLCTNAATQTGCVRAYPDQVINNKFYTSRGQWEPFDEYEYRRLNLDVAYMVHAQLWMDGRQVPSWGLFNYTAAQHFIDFGAWEGQYGRNFNGLDYDII